MAEIERFYRQLRLNNIPRTAQGVAFYVAVAKAQPVAKAHLIKLLKRQLSTATIYRLIPRFIAAEILTQSSDGLLRLSDRFSQHHHTRTCRGCGAQQNFNNQALEKAIIRYSTKSNFAVEDHQLEFTGLCQACQTSLKPLTAIGTSLRRFPAKVR